MPSALVRRPRRSSPSLPPAAPPAVYLDAFSPFGQLQPVSSISSSSPAKHREQAYAPSSSTCPSGSRLSTDTDVDEDRTPGGGPAAYHVLKLHHPRPRRVAFQAQTEPIHLRTPPIFHTPPKAATSDFAFSPAGEGPYRPARTPVGGDDDAVLSPSSSSSRWSASSEARRQLLQSRHAAAVDSSLSLTGRLSGMDVSHFKRARTEEGEAGGGVPLPCRGSLAASVDLATTAGPTPFSSTPTLVTRTATSTMPPLAAILPPSRELARVVFGGPLPPPCAVVEENSKEEDEEMEPQWVPRPPSRETMEKVEAWRVGIRQRRRTSRPDH